jgi:cysteine-rich repeat protein
MTPSSVAPHLAMSLLLAACFDPPTSAVDEDGSSDTGLEGESSTSSTTATPEGDESSTTDGPAADESSSSSGDESGPPVGPSCGDGRLDAGEVCDDGNASDGDGCNSDCVVSGSLVWAVVYDREAGLDEEGIALAFGADGRVGVVGATSSASEDANDVLAVMLSADGEPLWSFVHDSDGEPESEGGQTDRGHGIAIEDDGEVILAGYEFLLEESVWVAKLDAAGELAWSQSDPLETGRAYGVAATDGNVYVVGSFGPTGFLRRYNTNGASFWTVEQSGTEGCNGCDRLFYVEASEAGVVAGGVVDNVTADAWLGAFDAEGDEQWSEVVVGPLGGYDGVGGIARRDGSTLVLYGMNDYADARLQAYDDAGAVQWTLDDPLGTGVVPSGLAATADGGFVLATNLYDSRTTVSSVRVVRFDAEGGVVWESLHAMPRGQWVEIRDVAVGADGRIGLAGIHFESGATDTDAWVAVLAP